MEIYHEGINLHLPVISCAGIVSASVLLASLAPRIIASPITRSRDAEAISAMRINTRSKTDEPGDLP